MANTRARRVCSWERFTAADELRRPGHFGSSGPWFHEGWRAGERARPRALVLRAIANRFNARCASADRTWHPHSTRRCDENSPGLQKSNQGHSVIRSRPGRQLYRPRSLRGEMRSLRPSRRIEASRRRSASYISRWVCIAVVMCNYAAARARSGSRAWIASHMAWCSESCESLCWRCS